MKRHYLLLFLALSFFSLSAQDYFPKNDGVKTSDDSYTVFTNATIHTDPKTTISKGTLVIQKDRIIAVGKNPTLPKNSIVYDLKGKHIYPSFIDIYTNFGIAKATKSKSSYGSQKPIYDATREGYYWNDHIRPDTDAVDEFSFANKEAKELISLGFGVVQSFVPEGIARGTGLLVALDTTGVQSQRLLLDKSAQFYSFKKSSKSQQAYPTSLMGAIALLKQVHYDMEWYKSGRAKTKDLALEALLLQQNLPAIFEANDVLDDLRVDALGDGIGRQYTIVGGGNEYERISEIKATNATYILPINFPKAYDVSDPYAADLLTLESLREWNQAPTNPAVLEKNAISFALTTFGLKSKKKFATHLAKAITYGLSTETALAALTTIPARIVGKEQELGVLKPNAYANFLVTDKPLFKENTIIHENWIQGKKSVLQDRTVPNLDGKYNLAFAKEKATVNISNSLKSSIVTIYQGSDTLKGKLEYKNKEFNLLVATKDSAAPQFTRLTALVLDDNQKIQGTAIQPDGSKTSFSLTRNSDAKDGKSSNSKNSKKESPVVMPITYPNTAYGFSKRPEAKTYLFRNATVWTNEAEGIMENMDVLVKDGKITGIGKGLKASGAEVIDATGKHLTSGIIDEHSHIATDAINESGQNSSAEVTIEDVINHEDISIYRNLAGGVTSIQILHGSANPIGGRSAILKLKWGASAEEMRYTDSPKFIKFALGENVKQSNWGDQERIRFPQSRMGVEQVYMDYFSRAKAYDSIKKTGQPYRKDLEMETLAEILNKERFISCHSYIQSEIVMLMRVAEKFDFNINTFTHILEGYKVADKMKNHGAGGSTFSDWWAYKYEVRDAIPYNAAIMHNQGVVTAINSDDPEMSRRLNQEAAKTVKYGGVPEEEAWKFVTLNPAKLLHLDDRTGSIKVGKDADLVLWNDHPLSIYTKAEKTMVDGVIYFDLEHDAQMQKQIAKERNQLITMLLKEKNKGASTQSPSKKAKVYFHCESVDQF